MLSEQTTYSEARDLENLAAEALADHTSSVGEACIREMRAPTVEEELKFYELEVAYDAAVEVTAAAKAREERIAKQVDPIFDRLNAEAVKSAQQYRRSLEGRGF